jgi:DNA-binding FadR family transcriptional regulator
VVREIGQGIVSGHYPQGELLPGDAELMELFRVSRTVLREALRVLAGKGLIRARARVGTRVEDRSQWNMFDSDVLVWEASSGLDQQFLAHLSEMRFALEPEAAALAARRRTDEQLAEIYNWLEVMANSGTSRETFVAGDLQFHLAVSVAAGNPFLRSIATLIEVALTSIMTISSPVDDPDRLVKSISDHKAIADAIAGASPDVARAAMRVVIQDGVDRASVRVGR